MDTGTLMWIVGLALTLGSALITFLVTNAIKSTSLKERMGKMETKLKELEKEDVAELKKRYEVMSTNVNKLFTSTTLAKSQLDSVQTKLVDVENKMLVELGNISQGIKGNE